MNILPQAFAVNLKKKIRLGHYQRLLNVEFDWFPEHLFDKPPVEGLPFPVPTDMVKKAISQMEVGKATGPAGIVVEMIRAAGDPDTTMIHDLAAAVMGMAGYPLNAIRRISWGLKKEFQLVMVKEQSVIELLRLYCSEEMKHTIIFMTSLLLAQNSVRCNVRKLTH